MNEIKLRLADQNQELVPMRISRELPESFGDASDLEKLLWDESDCLQLATLRLLARHIAPPEFADFLVADLAEMVGELWASGASKLETAQRLLEELEPDDVDSSLDLLDALPTSSAFDQRLNMGSNVDRENQNGVVVDAQRRHGGMDVANSPGKQGGISVIVPAHNNANAIRRTLESLIASDCTHRMQIIVAANACTDGTEEVVASFGRTVDLVKTPIHSTRHAINLGDRLAKFKIRAYLPAGVVLGPSVLEAIIDEFKDPCVRLVVPLVTYVYNGKNPFLNGYYSLWRSLPHVKARAANVGFYCIDQEMRLRFREFPSLVSTDQFILKLCKKGELRILQKVSVEVAMPSTVSELLHEKTRWNFGSMELMAADPKGYRCRSRNKSFRALCFLLPRFWYWLNIPMFLFITICTFIAAKWRFISRQRLWEAMPQSHPRASLLKSAPEIDLQDDDFGHVVT